MSDTSSEFLKAREVADRLRVGLSTVSRWAATGVLPSVRIGGSLRFRAEDIDALIAERSTPAEAPAAS